MKLAITHFQVAAAYAATFELKLRMLCDRSPVTCHQALEGKLVQVCREVISHHSDYLEQKDVELLKACVGLRNKLFHQQHSKATGTLVELGVELRKAGVWKADFSTGEIKEVEKTSTRQGRIFGWLLAGTSKGSFEAAAKVFMRGCDILDQICETASIAEVDSPGSAD